ncbi:MAG TPA: lipid-binding SYLF domain-containing protein [Vicinamibacterales bacterium]|nr:lipid-binding SYLF domain-containing protein [Vicinamibacterales bacterium]
MRLLIFGVAAVLATSVAASAQMPPTSDTVHRLKEASTVLTTMRANPDKSIPANLWNQAACVAVIPSVKKAAFVVGGEYGRGVVSCRHNGQWTAPAFIELEKGSWGFQVGAEEIDLVLLVMNHRGMEKLLQDKVVLGGDASASAGPVGRTTRAETDAQMSAEILSYSDSRGLFAGVDITGGVLHPDEDANHATYGPNATARQILSGGPVTVPAAARSFMTTLAHQTVATTGR